jgi:hypothetical protein
MIAAGAERVLTSSAMALELRSCRRFIRYMAAFPVANRRVRLQIPLYARFHCTPISLPAATQAGETALPRSNNVSGWLDFVTPNSRWILPSPEAETRFTDTRKLVSRTSLNGCVVDPENYFAEPLDEDCCSCASLAVLCPSLSSGGVLRSQPYWDAVADSV